MEKRLAKKLAKKKVQKQVEGLSAELQERIKKAKEGQGIVISNEHQPMHGYKLGTIVNILSIDCDGDADCTDGRLPQWVNLKDMIIKGK